MITVAIDGYSSCGKSTMAKQLAKAVGYTYVDTGAMYRAVALYAIRRGWINGDKVNRDALIGALENIDIRQ
ncbi:MAG: (d)CMP kinase, partial [Paludibacteraceae bacterium]|nr:(d)CMP kinase [Paludibacteraceae bacterium]